MDPRTRIKELTDLLKRANRAYYVDAKPIMSDAEFDGLLEELAALEAGHPDAADANSPTRRVGGEPIEGFEQRAHATPMLSIENSYVTTRDEARRVAAGGTARGTSVEDWAERCFAETDPELAKISAELRDLADGGAGGLFEGGRAREERAIELRRRRDEILRLWRTEGGPGEYCCDPKVDGVAISLRYERGKLAHAVTRGDGVKGDDVTHAARVIRAIPLTLEGAAPAVLEVRGEVFMTTRTFERINRELEEAGEDTLANPRNATAGTLKNLDPNLIAARRLSFLAHGRGEVSAGFAASHSEFLRKVRALGVPTSPHAKVCGSVAEVVETIAAFGEARRGLEYATDGMVVRVNRFDQQEAMGATAKSPRWVIAFKYPPDRTMTVLLDVLHQVGKTGKITPRAVMKPVLLAGTTVQHATLHNYGQVRQKDIRIGDTVEIEKRGEIIPYVEGVVYRKRPPDACAIEAPEECPACGGPVEVEFDPERLKKIDEYPHLPGKLATKRRTFDAAKTSEDRDKREAEINALLARIAAGPPTPISARDETCRTCLNPECPAQIRERLVWFVGRRQMNIDGLGESTIDLIRSHGGIPMASFADIFHLKSHRFALLDLEGFGIGKLERILDSIEQAKSRGLATVLSSMGIRHVGHATAKLLARRFGTIERLKSASLRELMPRAKLTWEEAQRLGVSPKPCGGPDTGLGRLSAVSVFEYLHSEVARKAFEALHRAGVRLDDSVDTAQSTSSEDPVVAGKRVVITGTFGNHTRDSLRSLLEQRGAICGDTVSKSTDLLFVGADPGSKLAKAEKLGVPTWEMEEVLRWVESTQRH